MDKRMELEQALDLIPYKEIIIGETNPDYMKIFEFIDNDSNVDIFEICQKIKIKNVGGILV